LRGDEAERTGIGDRGDQRAIADASHPAHDDRGFDAKFLGDARLDSHIGGRPFFEFLKLRMQGR
jgi:hypothetical protein